jgi:hypothetical protein
MSEDCLYLAIIRPSNVTLKNLPVLVSNTELIAHAFTVISRFPDDLQFSYLKVYFTQGGFSNGGIGYLPDFNQTGIVQRSAYIGHPIIGVEVNSR